MSLSKEALERLEGVADWWAKEVEYDGAEKRRDAIMLDVAALRALLSERAELVARVGELEEAIEGADVAFSAIQMKAALDKADAVLALLPLRKPVSSEEVGRLRELLAKAMRPHAGKPAARAKLFRMLLPKDRESDGLFPALLDEIDRLREREGKA